MAVIEPQHAGDYGDRTTAAVRSGKFRHIEDFGPTSVREFVEGSHLLRGRTADQWQQDAFGQVEAWLRGLGLRPT